MIVLCRWALQRSSVDNFIGVLLVIVGTGALIQGGLIIQDVSIQNTNRNVETTVAADSLYSQMVSDAQKDLAHYRELENKNDASFRSSKRLALQQIAYADSMRYARAKGAYAVSWQSRFVFITASLIFFVGNVYIFHLFSIAGSYKIKEKKEPKQSSENVSNLSPYLSRMNGTGNGAAKKSKTRKISGDAAGKLAKSEAFKDAIIELIRLKATGEYREGDGRPGTNDASSASELSRTYGLNRAESESLRRYSKKDAGYLENKFHAIVKKRTRASELQGMELQAKKSKNGKY